MEIIPLSPSRTALKWSLGFTAVVWLLVGPIHIPFVATIPVTWRLVGALFIIMLQLGGPGRIPFVSALQNGKWLSRLPGLLSGGAILLLLASSLVLIFERWPLTELDGPVGFHLHSASFLISLDLITRFLINWGAEKRSEQTKESLRLTTAMAQRIKDAKKGGLPYLDKILAQVPSLHFAVLLLALASFVFWIINTHSVSFSLVRVATVLAICSPWIWLIGIPNTYFRSLEAAARNQVLLASMTSLEVATRINAVLFGKRGTLTHSSPRITDIIPMSEIDEEELLLWAASAEHGSRHPFGRAIVAEAQEQSIPLEPPERFTEMTGRGVECVIDGQAVRLGMPAFFDQRTIPAFLADRIEMLAQEGKTPFLCSRDDQYLGILALTEPIRDEAAAVIEKIRELGLRVILITGDDRMMAQSLAQRLHMDQVIAEVLPEDKPRQINKLRREGFRVAMVGGFPEDNASFSESELGISLTRGKGLTLPPIDVILLEDRLEHVVSFFELSGKTHRLVRENRFFGIAYHALAALIAAGCLVPFGFAPISPMLGALIGSGAMLTVTLNNRRMDTTL